MRYNHIMTAHEILRLILVMWKLDTNLIRYQTIASKISSMLKFLLQARACTFQMLHSESPVSKSRVEHLQCMSVIADSSF